jgi:hypothetical protein
VTDATFYRFNGASGSVKIKAPFPISEIPEAPTLLFATTVAYIL